MVPLVCPDLQKWAWLAGCLAGSEESKTVTLLVFQMEQLVRLPKVTFFFFFWQPHYISDSYRAGKQGKIELFIMLIYALFARENGAGGGNHTYWVVTLCQALH